MIFPGDSVQEYFNRLEKKLEKAYEKAEKARSMGFDPEEEPEIPLTKDLAARVEKLAGPEGVADAIRKLEKEHSRENLAFKIAGMIVDDEFGRLPDDEAAEQSIRTCLAIITEGIAAAAPIEGITHVDIKRNFDGSSYLAIYFAGPIRSAGGTAAALAVLTGDFVRRKLNLSNYKPSDLEIERMVEEVDIYEGTAGLQYVPSEEEVREAYSNIPVEVTGEPTESETVTGHRDLERVETNRVRGGAVLAIAEGVLQKAPKISKHLENLGLQGWEWLDDLDKATSEESEERKYPKGDKYLTDIIAGRPVFSYPANVGGFRLRYGRARNTGLAAAGIHPATMRILDDHVSAGTQLKTERPGKATAIAPVDTIEGPVVKLEDGSVVEIDSSREAKGVRDEIGEILSLGDILFGYGEFLENNHPFMPAGYCEEWWAQEVKKSLEDSKGFEEDLTQYIEPPFRKPAPEFAVAISEDLGVPLHPAYTYNFHDLDPKEIDVLGEYLASGDFEFVDDVLKKLTVENDPQLKDLLEALLVPHRVDDGKIIIGEEAFPLSKCLGLINNGSLDSERLSAVIEENSDKDPMKILEISAGFPVREKSPTRIGVRVGRPEKTKPRKMSPPPHVLFPVGMAGGKTRNLNKAMDLEKIEVEVASCKCSECGSTSILKKCPDCGSRTDIVRYCPSCDREMDSDECLACGSDTSYFRKREVEIKSLLNDSLARLDVSLPDTVKGVKGMMSAYKLPEPIEKGILRAKHDLYVFKDGTVRFDATDLPLTHFRPREVEVSLETLKELGYEKDYKGNPLEDENQILELKVQDILIPPKAADYLLRSAQFVDELLEKLYDQTPYYNASEKEDLIGELVIGLAPHTSAGITGRIIGFSEANVGYAHPYFHAAKRRNCDGDEDAIMLLLDGLLNFSEYYLPESRGGKMDAPLVLTPRLDPSEIDDEAHNVDVEEYYPIDFYEATLTYEDPASLDGKLAVVKDRLGTAAQYKGVDFSAPHDPTSISAGPKACRYKSLGPMEEKTDSQLSLARKIRAVDESDVAERLIENHFIPDLRGNLRAFFRQKFRCPNCESKYRRIPLTGKCTKCGGDLILTVTRGGVEKYMKVAMRVSEEYNVTSYTKQRLGLIEEEIESVFESDFKQQLSLADFA
ncbi:hypothetical protein AKJ66_01310 [candidate division MSBL1 archaeon SCGC-AAA259E22]|uniref:DNA polymerase II large subunit n=1 Tax=candidate division MSBL1 archaeon SCGC-AAA259E22 TaxID=1698265 RepID=A0A133UHN0_9EURY|nr:hypothetical protein AKJ66_01310 [candidate division MSBL1 archaeon SCGC-AAA259E22]